MNRADEFEKIELDFCKQKFNLPYVMTMYDKETLRELAEFYLKNKVNAISDEFEKILEDESDCFGVHLTKGTIRGSEALDAFEIWINKLLKK